MLGCRQIRRPAVVLEFLCYPNLRVGREASSLHLLRITFLFPTNAQPAGRSQYKKRSAPNAITHCANTRRNRIAPYTTGLEYSGNAASVGMPLGGEVRATFISMAIMA